MNKHRQRGVVILTLVTIILLGVTTLLVTQLSVNRQVNQRQATNLSSLSLAKQTLIGYALRQPIPGTLPCPDNTGDGLENPQGADCESQLGLLPHRTLNLPELTDGTGARLWYAVDLAYTGNAANLKNSSINTSLTLDGTTQVAVILAPAAPLGVQSRRFLNQTDHLEGINADVDFNSFTATQSDVQNDQVIGIDPGSFWSVVEQRVLSTAGALVNNYRNACGEYPFAADFSGPFTSVNNLQLGALPLASALPTDWGNLCGAAVAPNPETWLVNHWSSELMYRMCTVAEGNCLTVIGASTSPVAGVIVAPGITLGGQARPDNDLADYFEDENSNLPDSQFRRTILLNHDGAYNDLTNALSP